jgi:hypothetical protein
MVVAAGGEEFSRKEHASYLAFMAEGWANELIVVEIPCRKKVKYHYNGAGLQHSSSALKGTLKGTFQGTCKHLNCVRFYYNY